jgi:ribokinase
MQQQGINVSQLLISDRNPTGFGAGFYLENGSVMGATYAGATVEITREFLDEKRELFAQDYDVFLVSLEIPSEVALYGLELAYDAGIPLRILNPSPADDLPRQKLHTVDTLTPNEPEARLMASLAPNGREPIEEIAGKIATIYNVPLVIVTLGKRGCFVQGSGMVGFMSCPDVKAVDTSGAGDCFNSAFALSMASGWELRKAIDFALRAASLSVTRRDSWPAYPTF